MLFKLSFASDDCFDGEPSESFANGVDGRVVDEVGMSEEEVGISGDFVDELGTGEPGDIDSSAGGEDDVFCSADAESDAVVKSSGPPSDIGVKERSSFGSSTIGVGARISFEGAEIFSLNYSLSIK